MICPQCKDPAMMGREYPHIHPERYDGISEWVCQRESCGARVGRWTGRLLTSDQVEPRYGRGALPVRDVSRD